MKKYIKPAINCVEMVVEEAIIRTSTPKTNLDLATEAAESFDAD